MLYRTSIANTYEMNTSFVLYFHATINWIISNNLSLKDGGIISVNDSLVIIYLNWLPVMDIFNQIGSPSNTSIEILIKSYVVYLIRRDEDP